MALTHNYRLGYKHVYNCAMATINNGCWKEEGAKKGPYGSYSSAPSTPYIQANLDALIKDFLTSLDQMGGSGSQYNILPFYVFHDNVKGDKINKDNPFTDLSALCCFLYENQKKYGITVVRTPMVDNHYHPPVGSHPGRVYVITPPGHLVLDKGVKVPAECKKVIKDCLMTYEKSMSLSDVDILKDIAA